jgi:hypothetical protein
MAPTEAKPTRRPTVRIIAPFPTTYFPTESITEGIIPVWPGKGGRVLQNVATIIEEGYERIAEAVHVDSTEKTAGAVLIGTGTSWDELDC